jgi:hypothetical protein
MRVISERVIVHLEASDVCRHFVLERVLSLECVLLWYG